MSFVRFLKRLRGDTITVELKDGAAVTGTIESVNRAMNITLLNTKTVKRGVEEPIQDAVLAIRGTSICQIILPDALNIDSLMSDRKGPAPPQAKRQPK